MSLSSVPVSKSGSDHGLWVWRSCDGWFSRLRRALLSSCFAKKKVSKEEGDPGRRRALPGSLRYSVGAGAPREYFFPMLRIAQGAAELAATRLKQSSPFFRPNLRCSASHKGPGKRHGTTSGSLFQTLFRVSSLGVRRFSPSRRQRRATEGFAEIARGLSEARRAEFRSAREDRVAQGTLRSRALTPGRLFFAYFLLAKQKKVRRAASAKPHSRTSAKPKYRGLSPVSGLSCAHRFYAKPRN